MSLVESVERIVVSALAQQAEYDEDRYGHGGGEEEEPPKPDSGVVTRDIINAIAAELDGPSRPMVSWSGWDSAITTLRASTGS